MASDYERRPDDHDVERNSTDRTATAIVILFVAAALGVTLFFLFYDRVPRVTSAISEVTTPERTVPKSSPSGPSK